jgi:mRNA-degrading endonuclease RelE of RelBE toxin-antitoxin system
MNMELQITDSARFALRTLSARGRKRIQGRFTALENWDSDPHIQTLSTPLKYKDKDVYVLRAGDGMLIFFSKSSDKIVILDIARRETVEQFADAD